MNLTDRLAAPSWKPFANRFYPLLTRRLGADDLTLLNWGYEEDPPMAVPLATSDEPDRFCIQLYHRTATQAQLGGQRILEVSCGHGGGAAYLARTQRPAAYTGLDLNAVGIDYCRKKHHLPGLNFVNGDAEDLPFTDHSFDAVINVEASHCYPRFPRFLGEVARVLRPGGHFLYTDMRPRNRIAEWEADLADAPMRMLSHAVINEQVMRGMEKNMPRSQDLWARHAPAFLRRMVRNAVKASNSKFCHGLQSGQISYRMYCFAKD